MSREPESGWVWDQSAGELRRDGARIARGYAGKGTGKNNPAMQNVRRTGPIPQGRWRLTGVHNSPHTGPFTIILVPEAETETFGRSAFRIHGDSIRAPGTASEGCIILPRAVRERIWSSGDRRLTVVT